MIPVQIGLNSVTIIYTVIPYFTKVPLILSSDLEENLSPASYVTMRAYKTNVMSAVLLKQGSVVAVEWQVSNFP